MKYYVLGQIRFLLWRSPLCGAGDQRGQKRECGRVPNGNENLNGWIRNETLLNWGPGDKNDEGYLIAELAQPLPTHLSIIKTMLVLQSEPAGSDEENVVRFKELLSVGKITNQFVFNIVAACCEFYAFGWMARHILGDPQFQHFHAERRVTSSLVDCDAEFEKSSAVAG